MAISKTEIKEKLLQLLPEGAAWNKEADSDLDKLCESLAYEFQFVLAESEALIDEANPLYMTRFLDGREDEAITDDDCQTATTLEERKNQIIRKWKNSGGQSQQFIIDAANDIGYTITITEPSAFLLGSSTVGDAFTNGDGWAHSFYVNADLYTIKKFKLGVSGLGEPFAYWGNEELECLVNSIKPAHTNVIYAYT